MNAKKLLINQNKKKGCDLMAKWWEIIFGVFPKGHKPARCSMVAETENSTNEKQEETNKEDK